MLIGESNVAIDPGPAIGGYGAADIYLGEFSPHSGLPLIMLRAAIMISAAVFCFVGVYVCEGTRWTRCHVAVAFL